MQYADMTEIVDGFECAKVWRFVRKGSNDWSLVGLDESEQHVEYEVEHLYFKQVQSLVKDAKEDAEIVKIGTPKQVTKRDRVVVVLRAALVHLTNREQGATLYTCQETIEMVQALLNSICSE